jgi:pimeloyl-ACP methyl ester carboxylesterase
MRHPIAFAAFGAELLTLAASPGAAEQVVTIDTRPGVTQSFIFIEPAGKPTANLILFMGGNGKIALWRDPNRRNNNFLVRTRDRFAAQGFNVAVVDSPSDRHRDGLVGWRETDEHRTDIAAVIKWLTNRAKLPVWLVGTSRGTISAAWLGASLAVDGLVLTSSVTLPARRNPATALEAPLDRIKVPVLIVANSEDGCAVSPPQGANALKSALTASPKVEIELFDGGDRPRAEPCEAMSRHGYLGLEGKVVDAIARWIKAQDRR